MDTHFQKYFRNITKICSERKLQKTLHFLHFVHPTFGWYASNQMFNTIISKFILVLHWTYWFLVASTVSDDFNKALSSILLILAEILNDKHYDTVPSIVMCSMYQSCKNGPISFLSHMAFQNLATSRSICPAILTVLRTYLLCIPKKRGYGVWIILQPCTIRGGPRRTASIYI